MTTAALARPPHVPAGTELLGEIIAWTAGGSTKHLDLIDALVAAELDEGVARELAPRCAFGRACKKLSEQRIIRPVGETARELTFQFTAEERDGDRFRYQMETLLTLEKATGIVTCDLPGLATLAQEELDRCIEARTGSDVTRVVQRLFEKRADLFPIRPGGGAYFCPAEHAGFVDRVEGFLTRIHGVMHRFPVPKGTPQGNRSVKEVVAAGLSALIAEHGAAIAEFGGDTRPDTVARAAEKIRLTRHKVQAYAAYLAEERNRLEAELATASYQLRQKVEGLALS